MVSDLSNKIKESYWIFAINNTSIPLITSDVPIFFKTPDNKVWYKELGLYAEGCYIVYVLSPTIILYCYEKSYWSKLKPFNNTISPVTITPEMIDHENSGHAGLSKRFIFSSENGFQEVLDYISDDSNYDLSESPSRYPSSPDAFEVKKIVSTKSL